MVAGDDNGEWLAVAEAARRLGVSRQAIQNRIKRGKIEYRQDNRGNPIVRVAATAGQPVSGATWATPVAPTEPRQAPAGAPDMVPLALVATIQQAHIAALAALQGQVGQLRVDLESERQRHVSEIERLVGQIHAERQFWVERADAAEVRAEAAEQRVAEARRPWWTRLLGASKKTDLGE